VQDKLNDCQNSKTPASPAKGQAQTKRTPAEQSTAAPSSRKPRKAQSAGGKRKKSTESWKIYIHKV